MLDRAVRSQAWLDPVAVSIQKAVGAAYEALGPPGQSIKNVMHGTTALGHPLHPALTDVPVGAWTVGVLADWLFVATGRVPAVAGDLALAIGVGGGRGGARGRGTGLPQHRRRRGPTPGGGPAA